MSRPECRWTKAPAGEWVIVGPHEVLLAALRTGTEVPVRKKGGGVSLVRVRYVGEPKEVNGVPSMAIAHQVEVRQDVERAGRVRGRFFEPSRYDGYIRR
jgi:hypothetical protein